MASKKLSKALRGMHKLRRKRSRLFRESASFTSISVIRTLPSRGSFPVSPRTVVDNSRHCFNQGAELRMRWLECKLRTMGQY